MASEADEVNLKEKGEPENTPNKDDSTQFSGIHSANSWESAELGDDERKKKFLKLMGASKTKHQGRFVIGDHKNETARTKEHNEEITQNIEGIYKAGLQHKLTGAARSHRGLGFTPGEGVTLHNNDVNPSDSSSEQTSKPKPKLIGFCKAEESGNVDSTGDDSADKSSESEAKSSESDVKSSDAKSSASDVKSSDKTSRKFTERSSESEVKSSVTSDSGNEVDSSSDRSASDRKDSDRNISPHKTEKRYADSTSDETKIKFRKK